MTKRVLIIIGPDFEDLELFYPLYRLKEAGFEVTIAAPWKGKLSGKHGYTVEVNKSFEEINSDEYDALVIPGGREPERIRVFAREQAVRIIQHFMDKRKPVAAICHDGPQLLISAERVRGYKLTSYPGTSDDIRAAGGIWVNDPVVVDKNLVTARIPDDLPYWTKEFIKMLLS
ncbi:MAG: type 1 glutamine amidotransferase [Staphylothermus sp.]|nr:type 1 glutamine amidotransferase [Staphylothermus sp.]